MATTGDRGTVPATLPQHHCSFCSDRRDPENQISGLISHCVLQVLYPKSLLPRPFCDIAVGILYKYVPRTKAFLPVPKESGESIFIDVLIHGFYWSHYVSPYKHFSFYLDHFVIAVGIIYVPRRCSEQ